MFFEIPLFVLYSSLSTPLKVIDLPHKIPTTSPSGRLPKDGNPPADDFSRHHRRPSTCLIAPPSTAIFSQTPSTALQTKESLSVKSCFSASCSVSESAFWDCGSSTKFPTTSLKFRSKRYRYISYRLKALDLSEVLFFTKREK